MRAELNTSINYLYISKDKDIICIEGLTMRLHYTKLFKLLKERRVKLVKKSA